MSNHQDSLYNKLNTYGQSEVYPFHMPGHKRNSQLSDSPYSYDITEIDGFDNLHRPRGVLKESMDMATEFYGTRRTYYLVNGSTCGILSAISAVVPQGGTILMARNCHKSVYNAVYLRKLKAKYVYPRKLPDLSILGGIHPKDVEDMIVANPKIKAVVITSPTYEGVVSYVKAIASVTHKYNIPLIVDEAHGAHFSMSEYFPKSAIEQGADIVIQSVHKTLPSMTQTALLHVCGDMIDLNLVERYLSIYQSSSPSYVLMASIDSCIRDVREKDPLGFIKYEENLVKFREKAEKLTHLKLLDKKVLGKGAAYDLDLGKLVITVGSITYTGHDLHEELLKKYKLQMEMAASDYVIAMTSLNDTEEGFDRLIEALTEIDRDIRIREGYGQIKALKEDVAENDPTDSVDKTHKVKEAVVCMEVYEALDTETEVCDFAISSGRISAEYIYLYPPGVPVVVPGEMLDRATIDYLLKCKADGLDVCGQMDDTLNEIMVIKENWKEFSYGKNILPDGQKLLGEGYHI